MFTALGKMPTGPRGERSFADVIGAAVMVEKIAAGEMAEMSNQKSGRVRNGQIARLHAQRNCPPWSANKLRGKRRQYPGDERP